jgi:hypothetical protein
MDPSSPVTHSLQHETGSSGRRFKSKLAAFLLAASGIGSAGTFSACVQNSQSSDGGVATVDMAQADDLAAPADLAPSRTELNNVDVTIIYPLPPAADIKVKSLFLCECLTREHRAPVVHAAAA